MCQQGITLCNQGGSQNPHLHASIKVLTGNGQGLITQKLRQEWQRTLVIDGSMSTGEHALNSPEEIDSGWTSLAQHLRDGIKELPHIRQVQLLTMFVP
jgi:hypothetical protein